MIKIKVKIPKNNPNFPTQYQGKEVKVQVTEIKFPNGYYWDIDNRADYNKKIKLVEDKKK